MTTPLFIPRTSFKITPRKLRPEYQREKFEEKKAFSTSGERQPTPFLVTRWV
jgi:hypothetical protein